jgi:predicted amidohydrolase
MSKLTFTLVQTTLHWEDPAANLRMLTDTINRIKEKTQVVVLPEMFSTGFTMNPEQLAEPMTGPSVQWMQQTAQEKKLIITGSLAIKEDEHYFNRLLWMLPTGHFGQYDKRHLFAFAGEDQHYTQGSQRLVASVNGWKIQLLICYDLRFPVWSRQQPGEANDLEYDVLICVANWPERRSTAWKALLQARAIENQCYVIGVNRVGKDGNGIDHNGDSMVIDPLGEILYHKSGEEDLFTITLDKEHLEQVRTRFPFWRDADRFGIWDI